MIFVVRNFVDRGANMLSDVDIKRKLKKKNIAIAPFKPGCIEGASVYVNASAYAWSLKEGRKISNSDGEICIPAKDTGLIVTSESIYVDLTTAGVCLSRVRMVSDGVRHVGAPIKPGFAGRLVISIQNPKNEAFNLRVGDHIAVVMFHELKSKAENGWMPREDGVFSHLANSVVAAERDEVRRLADSQSKNKVIEAMENSEAYRNYVVSKKSDIWNYLCGELRRGVGTILVGAISAVIGALIVKYI